MITKHHFSVLLCFILLITGCSELDYEPPSQKAIDAAQQKEHEFNARYFVEQSEKLHSITEQLLQTALPLCEKNEQTKHHVGFFLYSEVFAGGEDNLVQTAESLFNFKNKLRISYVIHNSPASQYLKKGDVILGVDNQKIATNPDEYKLLIERKGVQKYLQLPLYKRCDINLKTLRSGKINAYVDASDIYITVGMLEFVRNNDELGLILAHEIAHVLLEHSFKSIGSRVAGGVFEVALGPIFGRIAKGVVESNASREMEREADYLGFHLAYLAKHNLRKAMKL